MGIQMVPPQFIAGGGMHLWLNLGPKLAWEKVSAGCCFGAFCLAAIDICLFFFTPNGAILSSCDDILNDQCADFHIRNKWHEQAHLVDFRRSLGWIFAAYGGLLALLACLSLR